MYAVVNNATREVMAKRDTWAEAIEAFFMIVKMEFLFEGIEDDRFAIIEILE